MDRDLEIIEGVAAFLDERKAQDIVVLDLRLLSNIADYFVVATGANKPHLKALDDGLRRWLKTAGFKGCQKAGVPGSGWLILDYHGVMVHLFEQEMRDFYDLEAMWKDAPRIKLEEV